MSVGSGAVAQVKSTCPARMRPGVQSPALYKQRLISETLPCRDVHASLYSICVWEQGG